MLKEQDFNKIIISKINFFSIYYKRGIY